MEIKYSMKERICSKLKLIIFTNTIFSSKRKVAKEQTLSWINKTKYPYFEWTGKSPNPIYKMAMHNFLAETPKFFLKNRGMTTIVSAPQNQFKKMKHKTDLLGMSLKPGEEHLEDGFAYEESSNVYPLPGLNGDVSLERYQPLKNL